jgi:WD40 repeat protein
VGEPLTGHTDSVSAVALGTDSVWAVAFGTTTDGRTLLASGSADRTVRLWDPDTGAAVGEPLTGHTRFVRAVAFGTTTDGRTLLATGSNGRAVRLWDPDVGDCLTTILRRTAANTLAANGSQLAIGDEEGVVVIELAADTPRASEFGWPE